MKLLSAAGKKAVFIAICIFCFTQWIGPQRALLLGIIAAITLGDVFKKEFIGNIAVWLLKISVVGLGFGMNFNEAIEVGKDGLVFTIISIASTLGFGYYLGKKLKVDNKTTTLISSGTAICGGSAIAVMAPVIDANSRQITVALGIVFVLNSVALFVFPVFGDLLHLSQTQFGYWSAIAIHDTSSVVGAASSYGTQALEIATNVKLQRALWILPLSLLGSMIYKSEQNKIPIPYFIFLFFAATLLNTFVPFISPLSDVIVPLAEKSLVLTLFLIGTGLSIPVIKKIGMRPMINGMLLWLFIAIGSLLMIMKTTG